MPPIIDYILKYLDENSPAHGARVRHFVAQEADTQISKAADFFLRYQRFIEATGRALDYGLDCYLKLNARMVHERMEFLRSGRYASQSFADVERQIYLNPEVFEYHMHGLVFAQFLWPEQSARFKFFCRHIASALHNATTYLEIGGGHGLYILEALRSVMPGSARFELVDISPSSMELARGITSGEPIEFKLLNIFDYPPGRKFDFIAIGEVIEHVEDPLSLLKQVRSLLSLNGTAFISTPANSATIDHIHLFSSVDEIRAILQDAGFRIVQEEVRFAENISEERARKLKAAVMYASFCKRV